MKIIIFGALGNVGSRVVSEAVNRGHKVSAVIRSAGRAEKLPNGVRVLVADALNIEEIRSVITGHDLVISAIRPPEGQELQLVPITQAILTAADEVRIRTLVVGGAATLTLPNLKDTTVLSAENFLPDSVRPIATACAAQHLAVEQSANSDWAYLSPAAMLVPGVRTGQYRLGRDELVCDEAGNSQISMEDFALVLLDEAEHPKHHQVRFTAAY